MSNVLEDACSKSDATLDMDVIFRNLLGLFHVFIRSGHRNFLGMVRKCIHEAVNFTTHQAQYKTLDHAEHDTLHPAQHDTLHHAVHDTLH